MKIKIGRVLTIIVIELITITILDNLMSGFGIDTRWEALLFVLVLGLINGFIRPFLIRLTLPITVVTLGLFSLLINGFLIMIAASIVPGITVSSFSIAILVSIGIAAINAIFNGLFAIDDEETFTRNTIKRAAKRFGLTGEPTNKPGIIFLEIDGLSHPVFQRAIQNAYMPNLSRMLRTTHKVMGWECDFASSTPACQAGILLGSNDNMPAFRWYDRKLGRVVTLGSPKDATQIEKERITKTALLQNNGVSINNMFSGGTNMFILTASKLLEKGSVKAQSIFYFFFVDPYNFARSIVLLIIEIFNELKDQAYQKRQGVEPRLDKSKRNFKFSLIRGVTTVMMRDMGVYTVIGSILGGVNSLYATFVGYDEVAHHAGVERQQAMFSLQQLDKQFAKIVKASEQAPRPYHFVFLSDHGQSQGATFKQRFNYTLEQYVDQLLEGKIIVSSGGETSESWERVNALTTEFIKDDSKIGPRTLGMAVKSKTNKSGLVELGPENLESSQTQKTGNKQVVVLASGNQGLISFTNSKTRLTYEQLNQKYPGLIAGLASHEGIGFVMVRSQKKGTLIIGKNGVRSLKTDKVTGIDPLAVYQEPNLVDHLKRTDSFSTVPDILVNSFYDPGTDEICAFEELIGAHGGIGGNQNKPFLMYPKALEPSTIPKIVGTENLHKILYRWVQKSAT